MCFLFSFELYYASCFFKVTTTFSRIENKCLVQKWHIRNLKSRCLPSMKNHMLKGNTLIKTVSTIESKTIWSQAWFYAEFLCGCKLHELENETLRFVKKFSREWICIFHVKVCGGKEFVVGVQVPKVNWMSIWSRVVVVAQWLSCVAKLCLTFYDPIDCSMPGSPVFPYNPEFGHIHVYWVRDAI